MDYKKFVSEKIGEGVWRGMVHIPIVMSTDNSYIPLVVSLTSLVENAGQDTFYDIYVLVDDAFADESRQIVERCFIEYEKCCSLSFINVGTAFDDASICIPHITRPTYYRLLIPDLLEEEKCIYLDTDTIVMSDLRQLYETQLDECYIAGVWHPGVVVYSWGDGICAATGIPSPDQYVNAGVLVMNLKRMRREGLVGIFLDFIKLNMPSQDQDIINKACYGKIRRLPFKYNVMTKLADFCVEDYQGCYSADELREAWNRPCIIHYADPKKPWNSSECAFMDQWWNAFRKCTIYGNIVSDFFRRFVTGIIYAKAENAVFSKKMPKLFDLMYERKYAVYGAGKRARDVILYLRTLGITPEFAMVTHMEGNPDNIEKVNVKEIGKAGGLLHDMSIIIAVRQQIQNEMIENLQKYDFYEILPLADVFCNDEKSM